MQRLLVIFIIGLALPAAAQNHNIEEPKTNNTLNGTFNTNSNNTNNTPIENGTINSGIRNGELIAIPDTFRLEVPATTIELEKKDNFSSPRKEKSGDLKRPAAKAIGSDEKNASGTDKLMLDDLEEDVDTPASASSTVIMKKQFESNQMNASRQYNRRSASGYEQMNMDNSVEYYRKLVPESFETHFYTYLAGHYNTDLFSDLQAAAELRPEDTEVIKQLAAYHIINNDAEQAVPLIRALIDTGVVSPGQLLYASDLLLSADPQSIIVTHGFEDMFATYYVQNTSAVGIDVKLLSLDFMQSETYRATWTNEDLALPESEVIDTAYLAALCHLNAEGRTIQLSMTLPRDYFQGMKANLYPVGLTFQYSETPLDNYAQNYALWSEKLNMELVDHPSDGNGDTWCTNYLPMLVTLRRQLQILGRKEELDQIDKQILSIGARTNNTDKVKKYTK